MKDAIKIGIDIRELEKGKLTGIGRFLIEFLKEAKNYKEFKFILFGNQDTDFSNDSLESYEKIGINEKLTFLWDQFKLKNALKENKIDLFFSPYYKAPLFSEIPLIISLFDLIYFKVEPYKNQLNNKFYIKYFINLVAKKAIKIITISNDTQNDLIKLLNLPKEKIKVVYLSVSENFYHRGLQEIEGIKKKYNINKKYILYIGNSNPHKNLTRLVEAYTLLPDKTKKEYELVLAGVGNFFNSQLSTCCLTTLNSKLLGFVPDQDLPALYSGAELFVFPSLYEGFGLPPLEAMACGCPVASSNTSCMPEILGEACVYFDPFSPEEMSLVIHRILNDSGLAGVLKTKGLARAAVYDPEKTCSGIIKVMESVGGL
jgi:glycosyltransferase involved in cell wall biosynthesis